jgi:hypothetical protein
MRRPTFDGLTGKSSRWKCLNRRAVSSASRTQQSSPNTSDI